MFIMWEELNFTPDDDTEKNDKIEKQRKKKMDMRKRERNKETNATRYIVCHASQDQCWCYRF